MEKLLEYGSGLGITSGWICQTPLEHAQGWDRYNERLSTWSETPAEAWRRWLERTRENATSMIDRAQWLPPLRMMRRSDLARKTRGLIEHDRYLLKVDSRQPGGKGNM